MAADELSPLLSGAATALPAAGSLEDAIASAERVHALLTERVADVRRRLTEAEARAGASPMLLEALGGIISEAEQRVEIDRTRSGVITTVPRTGGRP